MKTFSQLVKENNESKTFKYTVNIKLTDTVVAPSEGDAGELIDKEMDELGAGHDDFSYEIETIDAVEGSVQENVDQSLEDQVQLIHDDILAYYQEKTKHLPAYYKSLVKETLKINL